jgi:hypothetical protein
LFKNIEFAKPEINFKVFSGVDVTLKYSYSSTIFFFSKLFLVVNLLINPKKSPVNRKTLEVFITNQAFLC